ncbi:uncharacterized protein METZ01_LOCUS121704, partial [marine metagenome]
MDKIASSNSNVIAEKSAFRFTLINPSIIGLNDVVCKRSSTPFRN